MIAIGFVLLAFSYVIFLLDHNFYIPEWVLASAAVAFLAGSALWIVGVGMWLWKVMP